MKLKSVFFLCNAIVYMTLLAGCSAPKQLVGPVPKQTFTYDYKTPTAAKPGSAETLIGLIRPSYAVSFSYHGIEVFENFRKFMANDIEELLIDKGFRLKGPYQSYDEMVFNDKKDADIVIIIEIAPTFTAAQGGWKAHMSTMDKLMATTSNPGTYYYSYDGTVSLIGKINIVGYEPLSKEKIWVKSVEIPSIQNINISTTTRFRSPKVDEAFFNDAGVYNALGAALQEQYKGIMQKIDAHFDPQEFASLKSQIKELKAKKGY